MVVGVVVMVAAVTGGVVRATEVGATEVRATEVVETGKAVAETVVVAMVVVARAEAGVTVSGTRRWPSRECASRGSIPPAPCKAHNGRCSA